MDGPTVAELPVRRLSPGDRFRPQTCRCRSASTSDGGVAPTHSDVALQRGLQAERMVRGLPFPGITLAMIQLYIRMPFLCPRAAGRWPGWQPETSDFLDGVHTHNNTPERMNEKIVLVCMPKHIGHVEGVGIHRSQ